MLKVSNSPGPIQGPQLKRDTTGNNSFAELLARQSAKPKQGIEPTDPKGDRPTPAETEERPETIRADETDTREELIKLLSMSPAERIRYTMLQQMGLTEEALAQLPYEERERIENMIEQEIKRQLGSHYDEARHLRNV